MKHILVTYDDEVLASDLLALTQEMRKLGKVRPSLRLTGIGLAGGTERLWIALCGW